MEQDHNDAKIMTVCKLLKSVLRTKKGTIVFCQQFNMPQFLVEDDWKTFGEFKAILRDASRLASLCHNEEKLNGAYGPVIRKSLHDVLSREIMRLINAEQWSSDKEMMRPIRSEVKIFQNSRRKL